jgi:undecaprenyl pyrophosphate synthase
MSQLLEHIDKTYLPRHIAIIMDGKWSLGKRKKGGQTFLAIFMEWESVRNIVEGCAETWNWVSHPLCFPVPEKLGTAPEYEVVGLMEFIGYHHSKKEVESLDKKQYPLACNRRYE